LRDGWKALTNPQFNQQRISSNSIYFVLAHCMFVPIALTCWVGATRISDYWHFMEDVLGTCR
jgi:hypothetical protein